jgi:hypothetical protein
MPIGMEISFLDKIKRSDSLLDILIQCEKFLDDLDLYTNANWIDGEVVEGPKVSRYWVEFVLKYPYEKMPDPQGGMRLVFHGAKVYYKKTTLEIDVSEKRNVAGEVIQRAEKSEEKIWLITIKIPKRFIDDLSSDEIDDLEDEISGEDVDTQDAIAAQGKDTDNAFENNNNEEDEGFKF